MLEIRRAASDQFEEVVRFYNEIIDSFSKTQYNPAWTKDVYPDRPLLWEDVSRGQMYLGYEEGRLIAAMAVNRNCNAEYADCRWITEASPDQTSVLHLLCVHPDYARRGYAKQMVAYALKLAREAGSLSLRLDVLKGNLPAERLYPGLGFQYCGEQTLYYEDTDWAAFYLYEYPLL
ncbi:MAG: GNAT family N-acetyltransferase [Oscillospiraceae bacterium]|nr:GNAT family N-acetyltransferase [Oscillospiraceae bacterium]